MGGGPHLTCATAAEMRAALPDGGVLIGLDLGTQTIGTAFCDAGWSFAGAGKTLPRGKFARDLAAIRALVAGAVPARCSEKGLLLIGDPPELGPYTLPGNNYLVYDIPLFWRNLQEDVTRRIAAWSAQSSTR